MLSNEKVVELAIQAVGSTQQENYAGRVIDAAANIMSLGEVLGYLFNSETKWLVGRIVEVSYDSHRHRGEIWFVDPRELGQDQQAEREALARDNTNKSLRIGKNGQVEELLRTNVSYSDIGSYVYKRAQELVGHNVGMLKIVEPIPNDSKGKKDRWCLALIDRGAVKNGTSQPPKAPPPAEEPPQAEAPAVPASATSENGDSTAPQSAPDPIGDPPLSPAKFVDWAVENLGVSVEDVRNAWTSVGLGRDRGDRTPSDIAKVVALLDA